MIFLYLKRGPSKASVILLYDGKKRTRLSLKNEEEESVVISYTVDFLEEIAPNILLLSGRWKQGPSSSFTEEQTYQACYSPISRTGTFLLRGFLGEKV